MPRTNRPTIPKLRAGRADGKRTPAAKHRTIARKQARRAKEAIR